MSNVAGSMIANSMRQVTGYAKLLVDEVPADRFSERPAAKAPMNHATWIMGHLSIYPNYALEVIGHADLVVAKDGWEELFSFNSTCDDDTGQYPGKDEVVGHFMERHAAIGEVLGSIDDAVLAAELPDDHRMKARMGTVGNMVNFLLVAHPAIHLGQLSAWRRALGYGDALSRR